MSKVRFKSERTSWPIGHKKSPYRHCKIRKGFIMHKAICEQKCTKIKCPIVKEKKAEEKRKELKKRQAALKRKRAKETKEQEGVTRNLLLRPEDRKDAGN